MLSILHLSIAKHFPRLETLTRAERDVTLALVLSDQSVRQLPLIIISKLTEGSNKRM